MEIGGMDNGNSRWGIGIKRYGSILFYFTWLAPFIDFLLVQCEVTNYNKVTGWDFAYQDS